MFIFNREKYLKRLINIVLVVIFVLNQRVVYLIGQFKKRIENVRIDKTTQNIIAGNNG